MRVFGLKRKAFIAIVLAITTAGVAVVNVVGRDDAQRNPRVVDEARSATSDDHVAKDDDHVPARERSADKGPGSRPADVPNPGVELGEARESRQAREVASLGLTGRLAFTAMDEPVTDSEYVCNDPPCPTRSPSEIRVTDLGTGRAAPLTSSPFFEQGSSWSPDGSRLAYAVARGDGSASLYTMRSDGSDDRRIASVEGSFARRPTWSPDGRRIAFVLEPAHNIWGSRGNQEIWVVDSDGTDLHRVDEIGVNCGYAPQPDGTSQWCGGASSTSPAWSPDGRLLAFAVLWSESGTPRDAHPYPHVNVLDLETGEIEWIASGSQPAWSPDGKRLTVIAGCPPTAAGYNCAGDGTLEVVAWPSGQVIDRIGRPDRRFGEPAWSPDGKWIAFAASRSVSSKSEYARRSIWVARPNGQNMNVVIEGSQDYWAPSWTVARR